MLRLILLAGVILAAFSLGFTFGSVGPRMTPEEAADQIVSALKFGVAAAVGALMEAWRRRTRTRAP